MMPTRKKNQPEIGELEEAIVQNQQLQWDLNSKRSAGFVLTPPVSLFSQLCGNLILRPNT